MLGSSLSAGRPATTEEPPLSNETQGFDATHKTHNMNNIQHATRKTATGLRCNTTFMQHLFGAALLLCNTFWFHTNRRLDATLRWCHNSIKHSTVMKGPSGTLHWCNTTSIAMSPKAVLMLQYNNVCLNCMPLPHYFDSTSSMMPHFYHFWCSTIFYHSYATFNYWVVCLVQELPHWCSVIRINVSRG